MNLMDAILRSGFVVLWLVAFAAVGWGLLSTGPNCPGMDPSWIGWCE